MMRSRALCLLAVALCGRAVPAWSAPPATLRVLARSGDVANDGLALDTISLPAARSAADVAFVGTTSAILVRQGSKTAVVAKTGDPLPAGQAGTFDVLSDPTISDGGDVIAFAATLNGNVPGGLFRYEGGGIVPVLLGDVAPAGLALNAGGAVVFHQGSDLMLLPRGATTPVHIASLDDAVLGTAVRRARFLGRPVVNDAGAVAFMVDNRRGPGGGVFVWTAASGVVAIGRAGDASPVAGRTFGYTRRQAAAIDAAGRVAFTAMLDATDDAAVFVYDPSNGLTRTLAIAGTTVGTSTLTNIDPEYVGIDAGGRVVFEGRFDTARRLVLVDGSTFTTLGPIDSTATDFDPGVTAGTRLAWLQGGNVEGYQSGGNHVLLTPADVPLGTGFTLAHPGVSDAGILVCQASRSGLYRLQGTTLRAVVRDGDVVGGVGPLASSVAGPPGHVFRGDTLVILATDAQGRRALLVDGAAGTVKLVASGETAPVGGTFEPDAAASVDIAGRTVVFSSPIMAADNSQAGGLFKLRLGARPIRTLLRPGAPAPGGGAFQEVSLLGGVQKPVVRATLADGRDALVVLRGRRASLIARSGDAAPGGGVFGTFQKVTVDGNRALLVAGLVAPGDAPAGLFRWQRNRLQKIAATGDPSPAGGTFVTFDALDVAGNQAVFVATVNDGQQTLTGVFRGRPGHIETVAMAGAPLGNGGTLALDGLGQVTADGPVIGFVGTSETTSTVQTGLFEVRKTFLQTVVLAGQTTPLGGTYTGFADDGVALANGGVVFATMIDGVAGARAGLFALDGGR